MPQPLSNAVVVITGASSGIGQSAAGMFAARGATVVLAARREIPLREVARECRNAGVSALVVPTDVSREDEVKALTNAALEAFGRIDVWVNNAAVTLFGLLEECPGDVYDKVIQTNLFGYIYGARACIPVFREQGRGVLINVASMVSYVGQPYTSAYVVSKHAIRGFAESLRQELMAERDIHVCTILPASIDTPLFQHGANYAGRAARALDPAYPAEQVAAAIVRTAERPQREVVVGNAGRLLGKVHAAAPGFTERVMAHLVHRKHFQDQAVRPSPGNVLSPMVQGTGISGTWGKKRADTDTGILLAGAAFVVAIPLAWYLWQRTRRDARPPPPGHRHS